MTQAIAKNNADLAFKLHTELKQLQEDSVRYAYRIGEIMKQIRDEELWRDMDADSFEAYFADPELGFKKSSVYRSIRLVECFKYEEVKEIPVSKVTMIIPHLTLENRDEILAMAKSLSYGDLEHQLRLKRIAEVAPHVKPLPKIYPCQICGGARGIQWDELCHCGWTDGQTKVISKFIDKINMGGDLNDKE